MAWPSASGTIDRKSINRIVKTLTEDRTLEVHMLELPAKTTASLRKHEVITAAGALDVALLDQVRAVLATLVLGSCAASWFPQCCGVAPVSPASVAFGHRANAVLHRVHMHMLLLQTLMALQI